MQMLPYRTQITWIISQSLDLNYSTPVGDFGLVCCTVLSTTIIKHQVREYLLKEQRFILPVEFRDCRIDAKEP